MCLIAALFSVFIMVKLVVVVVVGCLGFLNIIEALLFRIHVYGFI